jgi:rare lipoprotein A
LPFNTKVRVTHLESGKTVTVRINDRGPFLKGRIIDLSAAAAAALGMAKNGIDKVRIDVFAADQTQVQAR